MNFFPQPCEFPCVSGHLLHYGMTNQIAQVRKHPSHCSRGENRKGRGRFKRTNGQGQVPGGQAPSDFFRLRAKQGHATSAKHDRFSAFSFLKFRIPHFAFPNKIPPSRPLREQSAFTLIELMAATTVLSIILLMMVGMQDQMSKAWSNSNRRTDATREARAACRLMAQDLSGLIFRRTNNDSADSIPAALLTNGVPFLYSSNGIGPITIPSNQPSASYFFGLSARKPSGSGPEDLGIFGYYIASTNTTNVSGFVTTNYNLYRHYIPASNAVGKLTNWFIGKSPTSLFSGIAPGADDILARNTCNLRITFYNRRDASGSYAVTNGLNYSCESGGAATYFSGNKIQVEISVYPEDFAQKIPYTDWGKSENIRKFARSYEFRIDMPRE